jgi:hypothetical protein
MGVNSVGARNGGASDDVKVIVVVTSGVDGFGTRPSPLQPPRRAHGGAHHRASGRSLPYSPGARGDAR